MALKRSLKRLLPDLGLKPISRVHLPESGILGLLLLEPLDHGRVHLAERGSSLVQHGGTHAVFAAFIRDRYPLFVLFQNRQDPAIAVTWFAHRKRLSVIIMEFSTYDRSDFLGGLQYNHQSQTAVPQLDILLGWICLIT